MKKFFFLVFYFVVVLGFSQNTLNPVSWDVNFVQLSKTEGEIVFTAKIDDKWHIYSQRPTDAGPIPTTFSITPNSNFELIGTIEEKDAHEEYVAAFDAKVFVFEHQAVFKQKIKRKTNSNFDITANVEFMTCNDMQCLPPKTVNLPINIPNLKLIK
jgi:DsbC/DsbD-like thiol-disulfide interchange protein